MNVNHNYWESLSVRHAEAIKDAKEALRYNRTSLTGLEAYGVALYSAGDFELALVQFYRANRYAIYL